MHLVQADDTDHRRRNPDPDLGEGELGGVDRDCEIAGRDQTVAATCDVTLHPRDRRLGMVQQVDQQLGQRPARTPQRMPRHCRWPRPGRRRRRRCSRHLSAQIHLDGVVGRRRRERLPASPGWRVASSTLRRSGLLIDVATPAAALQWIGFRFHWRLPFGHFRPIPSSIDSTCSITVGAAADGGESASR